MPNESFLPPINDASAVSAVRSPRNQVSAPGKLDSLPSASAEIAGGALYVPGAAGVADKLAVSMKDSSDTQAIVYPILGSSNYALTNLPIQRKALRSSGNTTMTAAMSGAAMLLDGATVAYTLPSIASSNDVGMWFDFLVTTASTGATITAQDPDILIGAVNITDFDTANTVKAFFPDGSDDLIITLNGTTKGGKVGSRLRLIAVDVTGSGGTRWFVSGELFGDGVLVTPFS